MKDRRVVHNRSAVSPEMWAAVGRASLLDVETERALLKCALLGDPAAGDGEGVQEKIKQDARDRLGAANLRLVVDIAKPYFRFHDGDELIQEGSFGIIDAIDKWDLARKTKFSTYAFYSIKARINNYHIRRRRESRDGATGAPDGETRVDRVVAKDDPVANCVRNANAEAVALALARVGDYNSRYRHVLERRFNLGADVTTGQQTLNEIGDELGVTKERVRQLEYKGLNRMRKELRGTVTS